MNSRARFVLAIGLLGALCFLLPGSLRADTLYTYTGNPYTHCDPTYVCNGTTPFLSITIDTTLSGASLDNLVQGTVIGGDLTASVSSYTMSDGTGLSITQLNECATSITCAPLILDVGTDASGNITGWEIQGQTTTGPLTDNFVLSCSNNLSCSTGDESLGELCGGISGCVSTGGGSIADDPGTWSCKEVGPNGGLGPCSSTPVPEPGGASLMLAGIGLVFVIWKLKT